MIISDAQAMYVGDVEISALHLGADKVWSQGSNFLSQQVTTQIDTEDPIENPMELAGISIPGILTTTTLIANTPISNDFEMNTLALPTITITTEVEEI